MTTISKLLGPIPIPVGGRILDPDLTKCFACTPPYEHQRQWEPSPDNPNRGRTLVLCFDGTGESFDVDNSNVVQFLAMLKNDDPTKQLVYYQAGIGTYTSNVLKTPIVESASKILDDMFAWNLADHIKEGYQFLMQNYRFGDQICIFGFSRGAFTARALAGMLQKVGLLPPCNLEQLPFAYAMYARDDDEGLRLSLQFKRAFCIDVRIKLVGVWDTVQSVGLIEKHLPFSGSNNAISYFRHALALDERRVKFRPFLFSECSEVASDSHMIERRQSSGKVDDSETEINIETGPPTNIEEVFFAGAHCDVGGGSVKNGERHSLARITLRWMIRECFKTDTGIIFDAHMLRHEVGLDIDSILKAPQPLFPSTLHLRRPTGAELEGFSLRHIPTVIVHWLVSPFRWIWVSLSQLRVQDSSQFLRSLEQRRPISKGEPLEELNDALSPIVDQIKMHPGWNIVEWIPWLVKRQNAEADDHFWAYKWIWNRGKGREVHHQVIERGMKVHRSVRTRMLAFPMDGGNRLYLPKIRFKVDGELRCLTREEWLADNPEYFVWAD
ncbi:hypothetical protein BDM02DRAFT_3091324 [Thelephora ganbajun]|uniref:Uncharacterized protein n=1 Tax=Thelephora ganbajun TaxID=370292 RepID=A0ACB6ZPF1_THEGA|nr:hypothetical protein BDM02DRAFT_3091324 [Thelephora ganbajun]